RLVKGPNPCSGRVEVLHNHQWGTVCDDDWSLLDASVVCQQLGCGTAISAYGAAHFGQGSGPIWLDNVQCSGTENALSECMARPWGLNNCDHGEDASVVCTGMNVPLAPFADTDTSGQHPLRLANGSNSCLGRVEVFHDQKWGTVCDDTWDLHDATVVCRQLGCGMALSAPGSAHFGPGSDPIWMDGVHCTGMESALTDCELSSWGEHNCGHSEDAGVVCSGDTRPQGPGRVSQDGCVHPSPIHPQDFNSPPLSPPGFAGAAAESPGGLLRLVGGPGSCAGRVEVLHNGTWGTVCDDGWGPPEGRVVCRQLGCGTLLSVAQGARYGEGMGQIWLDEVNCTGEERDLSECQARPWGEHNCHHVEDASVECSVFLTRGSQRAGPSPYFPLLGNSEGDQVRLVNYGSRCAGRVEVFHNTQWGTVCDDNWDLRDAEVVCRQLNCGRALSAPGAGQFGRGDGIIWMDETNCTGSESTLSACQARPWGINNCYHGEDAGVVC
ncbi:Deleted in malignant brain tumors 1 protein, partial [Pelecanus crispus]